MRTLTCKSDWQVLNLTIATHKSTCKLTDKSPKPGVIYQFSPNDNWVRSESPVNMLRFEPLIFSLCPSLQMPKAMKDPEPNGLLPAEAPTAFCTSSIASLLGF